MVSSLSLILARWNSSACWNESIPAGCEPGDPSKL